MAVELAAPGLVLVATAASLIATLVTAVPSFSFGFSVRMLGWLRSSSQDPMVAARLASLPLLPSGAPEDAVGTVDGGTSSCLFNWERGV